MSDDANIGEGVRRRRRERSLTLEDLASLSGVSVAMLSEVERGVKNPTVRLAYQIARALGCSLTDLIEESFEPRFQIVRAAERRRMEDSESGVVRHGLSTAPLQPGVELAWYEIPPHSAAGEMAPNRAGIIEHVTVLCGELTIVLGGESQVLQTYDSISYGAQTTMEYRNAGSERCEFFMVADASGARS